MLQIHLSPVLSIRPSRMRCCGWTLAKRAAQRRTSRDTPHQHTQLMYNLVQLQDGCRVLIWRAGSVSQHGKQGVLSDASVFLLASHYSSNVFSHLLGTPNTVPFHEQ